MLYKNTVFYNQLSPFPARIYFSFVSNMYFKSVTVQYVNPYSLVTCLHWWLTPGGGSVLQTGTVSLCYCCVALLLSHCSL